MVGMWFESMTIGRSQRHVERRYGSPATDTTRGAEWKRVKDVDRDQQRTFSWKSQ